MSSDEARFGSFGGRTGGASGSGLGGLGGAGRLGGGGGWGSAGGRYDDDDEELEFDKVRGLHPTGGFMQPRCCFHSTVSTWHKSAAEAQRQPRCGAAS